MVEKFDFEERVGFVLGVASIVIAFWTPIAGLAAGILGFNIAKSKKTPLSTKAKRLSTIGIVASIIIIALALIVGFSTLGQNFPVR